MPWVYRCVAAPRRVRKGWKGSAADAFAAAFEAAIAEQAAGGWEYVRTDLAPMEATAGFFGRPVETHQAVMVFRRSAPGMAASERGGPASTRTLAPGDAEPARREPEIPRLGAARLD